jgi:cytochrome c peroxidase
LGDPLAEQAQGPFLNPVEMAMDEATVVAAVAAANYAQLFVRVFPETDFTNVYETYDSIAIAIAAFERSNAVTRFNSKFDKFWAACQDLGIEVSTIYTSTDPATLPQSPLTAIQLKGLALFNDPEKGNCAACHTTANHMDTADKIFPPLFTDFTYENLGIPINWRLYALAGGAPQDLGLGGREDINDPAEYGKFKVPTLRNVAHSAPYGHNGYFPTLKEIVHFLNTRDVGGVWEDPEVPANVNNSELGNLGLTRDEEWAIVAFLQSLTDESGGGRAQ